MRGLGSATNLAARDQITQTPLRGVVGRRDRRVDHKHEQFGEVAPDPPTQLPLDRQRIAGERLTEGAEAFLELMLLRHAHRLLRGVAYPRLPIQHQHRRGPRGQTRIRRVDLFEIMDVPQ